MKKKIKPPSPGGLYFTGRPIAPRNAAVMFAVLAFLALSILTAPAFGQNGRIDFDVSSSVDWARAELKAQVSYSLAQAGLRLPTARFMGEEILWEAYPRLLRPQLLSLRVDSNATVRTLVERGELSLEELDALCRGAETTPPALSADLAAMAGRYTIALGKIGAFLSGRGRVVEPARPLIPVRTAAYTGIIIIADRELPIHGRKAAALAEPCFFPKIWDTDMNLIYERDIFAPAGRERGLMARYTASENIFRPTPSGLEGELAALAGPYPLRVLAREVFGINPTDLVIDRADAMLIISSENNRRLLREGKVILALNKETLAR